VLQQGQDAKAALRDQLEGIEPDSEEDCVDILEVPQLPKPGKPRNVRQLPAGGELTSPQEMKRQAIFAKAAAKKRKRGKGRQSRGAPARKRQRLRRALSGSGPEELAGGESADGKEAAVAEEEKAEDGDDESSSSDSESSAAAESVPVETDTSEHEDSHSSQEEQKAEVLGVCCQCDGPVVAAAGSVQCRCTRLACRKCAASAGTSTKSRVREYRCPACR